ncbi:MAG: DUF3071 domain-containing protein [Propionibacteriaceae bacterium]|jgi:hypothetical protein|nr:DUF3071 domain-containing protein [Propionibacteriaceae bacterium]
MDIALTPREIQARIRAGEPLYEVAHQAGVPPERIDAFAAPVLAERANAARQAQSALVRRGGEPVLHRTLGSMVADRLTTRGIDPDLVAWDATRGLERLWDIRAVYLSGSASHEAMFRFDPKGRFSVAANEDARWLIGEETTSHGPQPGRGAPTARFRGASPDENEPTLDLKHGQLGTLPPNWASSKRSPKPNTNGAVDYFPAGLTRVDGVYELSPTADGDALYDMLSSMSEDSVKIYTGLLSDEHPTPAADLFNLIEDTIAVMTEEFSEPITPNPAPTSASTPAPEAAVTAVAPPSPQPPLIPAVAPTPEPPEPVMAVSAPEPAPVSEPEQTPKRKSRKRASVPTWDEIMFGSPQLPDQR